MIISVVVLFHILVGIGFGLGASFGYLSSGAFWGSLVSIEVSVLITAIVAGIRIRSPFVQVMARARDLALAKEEGSSDLGDWTDLESTLAQIGEDLRESRERIDQERVQLKVLLNAISEAVLAVDSDERVIFANPRFRSIFARGAQGSVKGTRLGEWIRDPIFLAGFRRALQENLPTRFEFSVSGESENQQQVYQVSLAPVAFRREERMIGAMAILHDVSELKRAERMQSTFIADVSHELRTPLTSIQGYSETLEEELKSLPEIRADSVALKSVSVIRRNTARLMLLVGDLLELSSIEAGRRFHPLAVSTREISDSVALQLEPQLRAKKQKLEIQIDQPTVIADAPLLEQVLANLIDNAHKYCPEGTTIRVHWSSEGRFTLVRVIDNGPGIPREHLARLFDRFYRVDRSRSRDTGGSGLGLSVVRKIVETHQGELSVESEIGQGTVFTCRFPVI